VERPAARSIWISRGTKEKARADLAEQRVSFLTAAEVFANEIMGWVEDREDYGRARLCSLWLDREMD
jgi:uncharacterized DUF497 family protein